MVVSGGVVKSFHVDSQLLQMLCYFILLLLSFVRSTVSHCRRASCIHIKFKLKSKTFPNYYITHKNPSFSIQLLNVGYLLLVVQVVVLFAATLLQTLDSILLLPPFKTLSSS